MGKKLVICFDGTWNKPDDSAASDEQVESNVRRIYEAVDLEAHDEARKDESCKYYHKGVGTTGNKWLQVIQGCFGSGLEENMVDGYRFLVNRYIPGAEVYIFGFSRGAYTARSLVGMINNCGIVKDADKVDHAYELYRDREPTSAPWGAAAQDFRQTHAHPREQVKFLGVWDTVGARGLPDLDWGLADIYNPWRYGFHDTTLSSIVDNAYHAVAIDEHRKTFCPTLWTGEPKGKQKVEQVWFAGAHADVGGGYDDRRLSDVALLWMAQKAKDCGLPLDEATLRDGLKPNFIRGDVHDSFRDFTRGRVEDKHRFRRPICRPGDGLASDMLHWSVPLFYRGNPHFRPQNEGFEAALIEGRLTTPTSGGLDCPDQTVLAAAQPS